MNDPFNSLRTLEDNGSEALFYSLPALEEAGVGPISRLPVSLRIVLESLLRNCDGKRVSKEDVETLANWNAARPSQTEIPFVVSRIVLQDFTGVPLLVDLAAMRDAVAAKGKSPDLIEPLVPVDLVVDHSVQVDRSGTADAYLANLRFEFQRNRERYEFLKWGQQAFDTFSVVPPAIGIVHQVNLEYLAKLVFSKTIDGKPVLFPDSLVGTDSHTTMINGLGVVGWGVGGIEAEAGMLGQPVYFLTPEVVGVHLTGSLREGVTATDLTLRVTQMLRAEKVVGKFVEFFGEGATRLSVSDRATIANMAPEYGATMGFFPLDEKSLEYLRLTGRPEELVNRIHRYYSAQGLFGIPRKGDITYSTELELDLSTVVPSVAGPKRPQDRLSVPELKTTFGELLLQDVTAGGYGKAADSIRQTVEVEYEDAMEDGGVAVEPITLTNGSVVIAAITSCTNTSNPYVMLAAGLVARKAVERGLKVPPYVKCSLAPGSRVVTEYLAETRLQEPLDALGFNLVGYGCTTCIGNSGPLDEPIEKAIEAGQLVVASVLSGNRNFEARVHSAVKANFLMSPPLVVAYALAGRVDIDLETEPLGTGIDGQPVLLRDIWPSQAEIEQTVLAGVRPEMFSRRYADILEANPEWTKISAPSGSLYQWKSDSTYIQNPPFFEDFNLEAGELPVLSGMRPLAFLGDSVTTDHISPAGSISADSPAGQYLLSKGVEQRFFNSFGSRRGNDRIMTRGTFGNVRIKNLMVPGKEGGFTRLLPENRETTIFEASAVYRERGVPLIVLAGHDYGMGSSRDWAAKGTSLLGVRAVVARSFERIHRSNLIGMGVLPLQFPEGVSVESLGLDGSEVFSLLDAQAKLTPGSTIDLRIEGADGKETLVPLKLRIDTPIEVEYYRNGGILPYVLRSLIEAA